MEVTREVRGYFDGSGKSHDRSQQWIALAGYFAPEKVWSEFDCLWRQAIHPYPYLHMVELTHGKGPFEGMSNEEKLRLLTRIDMALIELEEMDCGFSIFGAACVADKRAYRDAKERGLKIGSIEAECGEWCFGRMLERFDPSKDKIQIYYDRSEQEFFTSILGDWENKSLRKGLVLSKLVAKPSPIVDSREVPAMQAADYLVSHVYQSYARNDFTRGVLPFRTIQTAFLKLDEAHWAKSASNRTDDNYMLY